MCLCAYTLTLVCAQQHTFTNSHTHSCHLTNTLSLSLMYTFTLFVSHILTHTLSLSCYLTPTPTSSLSLCPLKDSHRLIQSSLLAHTYTRIFHFSQHGTSTLFSSFVIFSREISLNFLKLSSTDQH